MFNGPKGSLNILLCFRSEQLAMTIDEKILSIIKNSGNSFHSRVTKHLKSKGWHTLVSPYYMDNATNKPREIDLVAEKAFLYPERFEKEHGTINIKLFIECKYIPQKVVFWFDEKNMIETYKWVIKNTPLKENNFYTKKHHYLSTNTKVAKLFAGETKRNFENEVIYKALNQSLNAMVYHRHTGTIIPNERDNYRDPILRTVELPIILCNSFNNFFRVEMDDQSSPYNIDDNFQLEVNYAYTNSKNRNIDEFFLIDVVDFSKLDNFLSLLDADIEAINVLI
jgi:hypothetical protein